MVALSADLRLALAGCTLPRIAAITGRSSCDVDEILKANYLGGQAELAYQAMIKMVAVYGSPANQEIKSGRAN